MTVFFRAKSGTHQNTMDPVHVPRQRTLFARGPGDGMTMGVGLVPLMSKRGGGEADGVSVAGRLFLFLFYFGCGMMAVCKELSPF